MGFRITNAAIGLIIYREISAKLINITMLENMQEMRKQYIHPRIHTQVKESAKCFRVAQDKDDPIGRQEKANRAKLSTPLRKQIAKKVMLAEATIVH